MLLFRAPIVFTRSTYLSHFLIPPISLFLSHLTYSLPSLTNLSYSLSSPTCLTLSTHSTLADWEPLYEFLPILIYLISSTSFPDPLLPRLFHPDSSDLPLSSSLHTTCPSPSPSPLFPLPSCHTLPTNLVTHSLSCCVGDEGVIAYTDVLIVVRVLLTCFDWVNTIFVSGVVRTVDFWGCLF